MSPATSPSGPDGSLYLAMGSRDNISDFKPGAQVFKVDADGGMSEFAGGIRNPVGIAFAPGTNTLYVAANERDGLGDDLPPDYFTSVKPGGFYGYPYAYTGKNPDPVWGARDPGGRIASSITPDVLFHAHSAPVGLVFYTGSNFPAEYRGDAFVSLHGSWNAAGPTGYKVVRVHFAGGKPENAYENFATGFWDGMGRKRPARQGLGPPRRPGGGQGRQSADCRRWGQCGVAGDVYRGEARHVVRSIRFGTHPGRMVELSGIEPLASSLRTVRAAAKPPERRATPKGWREGRGADKKIRFGTHPGRMVELSGIEPLASSLRTRRSPN